MSRSILIIGGGASGALLAIRLLRGSLDVNVTLVERTASLGRGLAYATQDDRHALNVVPGKMSAFADDPEHFCRWLVHHRKLGLNEAFAFVPRRYFGDYLETTLRAVAAQTGRLKILQDSVESLCPGEHSAEAVLATGRVVTADSVVLATGHDTPYVPVTSASDGGDLPILILGTGLSMADAWLSYSGSGRRIVAMSRRGLLPLSHVAPPNSAVEPHDLPFGAGVTQVLRWFRQFARRTLANSGDWRPAVDALRPHAQQLWTSWSIDSRRRFLRHLKPWWDMHRHRLPADVYRQLHESIAGGTLQVVAATPLTFEVGDEAQRVRFRRRRTTTIETLDAGAVIDCRGLVRDWRDRDGSLVSRLIANGYATPDPLGLGIEVTAQGEVVAGDGRVQDNLFAIGPLTRGRWFEIEAVPDIRAQCDMLAARLELTARLSTYPRSVVF